MKPLTLTRVAPTGYQPSLFGSETPILPPFNRSRGDQLRTLRQDLRLTINQAATRMGCRPQDVTALEEGAVATDYVQATERLRTFR